MFLETTVWDHSPFLRATISLRFLCICIIIATVSNFNVYSVTGWDPANIYLFKPTVETLEKGVKRYEISSSKYIKKSFW